MLSFSVPHEKDFFNFSVEIARVMFAGSRNMTVPRQTCRDLISAFGRLGFCFLTGCAKGVDESFRHALAEQRSMQSQPSLHALSRRGQRD